MKTTLPALALSFLIVFPACKKDKTITLQGAFVAGSQWDSVSGRDVSGWWNNGRFTSNNLASTNSYYGYGLAIEGNDIYMTGYENQPSTWRCHVWKNGQHLYALGDTYSFGNAIGIQGSNVVVAGGAYQTSPRSFYAMLWTNQTASPGVLASGSGTTDATSVQVAGNDIYVGGNENNTARIWKNGISLPLSNANGCTLKAIYVRGTDVFAAGYTDGTVLRYWKNGVPTDISIPAGSSAFIDGMTVSNDDVYLAGWESNGSMAVAKYWKNGAGVPLGDGIRLSRAHAITVSGTDIYVAGEMQGPGTFSEFATVWKNGVASTIGGRNSRARAIILK